MDVRLADVKLTPLLHTVQRLKISDEEYFSSKYREYISNSRLKYINPDQDGSPSKYKNGIQQETTRSLQLGSAIHEVFLQPESFSLEEDLGRPSAKLGDVCDYVIKKRAEGESIYTAISSACNEVGYYANSLTANRIKQIISKGLPYYTKSKTVENTDKIILSSKDREVCVNCLNSLNSHSGAMKLIRPTDIFGDAIASYNEDAIFMDVKCEYNGKSTILKLKMKADNWTIDEDSKKLVLNDLKTTGKPIGFFMQEYGSFVHYHYARQMGMYMWMLFHLCKKEFNVDKSWNISSNIIAVETVGENRAGVFRVSKSQLTAGKKEFQRLLKMVGVCQIEGFNDDIKFI